MAIPAGSERGIFMAKKIAKPKPEAAHRGVHVEHRITGELACVKAKGVEIRRRVLALT